MGCAGRSLGVSPVQVAPRVGAGPAAAVPSHRCQGTGQHLLPHQPRTAAYTLCWPLGTLWGHPPQACSLQMFLPGDPVPGDSPSASADIVASPLHSPRWQRPLQKSLSAVRCCRVRGDTGGAGTVAPTGPALWPIQPESCGRAPQATAQAGGHWPAFSLMQMARDWLPPIPPPRSPSTWVVTAVPGRPPCADTVQRQL